MILGLVSFSVVVLENFTHPPESYLLAFEFVHIWIFLVAVFFIFHAFIYVLLLKRTGRKWRTLERVPAPAGEERKNTHYWLYLLVGESTSGEIKAFKRGEAHFKVKHQMDDAFDFTEYLTRGASEFVVEKVEVGTRTWFAIIVIFLLNMARKKLMVAFATNKAAVEDHPLAGDALKNSGEHADADPKDISASSLWVFFFLGWGLFGMEVCYN